MRIRYCTVLMLISIAIGCSSIESTFLARNESNTGWSKISHLKGVPVTVEVPSHLKVVIREKHFIAPTATHDFAFIKLPAPIRDVTTEIVKTAKVFTVDFKRPLAGKAKLDMELDQERQYFTKIAQQVEDETISSIGDLIGDLDSVGFHLAGSGKNHSPDQLREVSSVVAIQMFEIDDPNLEVNVVEFLNCHLNQSHDAFTVPASVHSTGGSGLGSPNAIETPVYSELPSELPSLSPSNLAPPTQ